MIEYLKGKPLELPTSVTTDELMTKGQGTVTSNIRNGELLLVDESGKSFRISWSPSDTSDVQPRALPAGKYKLRNYRIVEHQKKTAWHISATAPAIQKLEVRPGKNLEVKIDPRITVSSKVTGRMGGMNIVGDHGAGLSIYREEKRIPIEYRLVDSYGETLAQGAMNYG